MEIVKQDTHIDFLGKRKPALILSLLLIAVSLGSIATRGMHFGIDFTGGVLLEVGYPQAADLPSIRAALESGGYGSALVQNFGSASDVLLRLMPGEGEVSGNQIGQHILSILEAKDPAVELRRVEFVGPQVGEELAEQGGLAMLFALVLILAYVAFRFQWKFAVGAVAALAHDTIITVGFFSVFAIPFDLSVLAAVLAVIGYSLNDTIVIFDRIRENFVRMRAGSSLEIMNASLNQTLSRTLITGVTTLLVLIALFVLGGEVLHGFSIALIVGIVIGTYSSVYIASALALALKVTAHDLMPAQEERAAIDDMP